MLGGLTEDGDVAGDPAGEAPHMLGVLTEEGDVAGDPAGEVKCPRWGSHLHKFIKCV